MPTGHAYYIIYVLFDFTENNSACMVSNKLVAAIKEKRTQEEIMGVLNEIPDDESDQMNPLKVRTSSVNSRIQSQNLSSSYKERCVRDNENSPS